VVSLGIPDALAPSWDKYLDEFLQKTKKIREEAYEYSKNYQRKVKQRFDKKARPHQYQNGQLVYLQIPKPRFEYSKTSPKYRGPFSLSEGDSTNFTLHDEKGRYQGPWNVNQLRPYHPNPSEHPVEEAQNLNDNDPIWSTDLYEAKRANPPPTGQFSNTATTETPDSPPKTQPENKDPSRKMALPMGTPTAQPILGHKWKKGGV